MKTFLVIILGVVLAGWAEVPQTIQQGPTIVKGPTLQSYVANTGGTLTLVQGPFACGVTATTLTLTAAANASAGTTLYSTAGTAIVGSYYFVSGFTGNTANNSQAGVSGGGPWIATAVVAGVSVTLANPNGVADATGGTAGLASCNIAKSLTAGNLYVFGAVGINGAGNTYDTIFNVTANSNGTAITSGSLHVSPVVFGSQHEPVIAGEAYVLATESSGATSPLTCVFSVPPGTDSGCVFYEMHDTTGTAALDLEMVSHSEGTATPTGPSGTLTGTGTWCFPLTKTDGASSYTALSSPYTNTTAYQANVYGTPAGNFWAMSAAADSSGGALIWKYAASNGVQMASLCFSYNPTAGVHRFITDFSGGTAGNEVTSADMNASTFGAQPELWVCTSGNANPLYYFNATTGHAGANPTPFVGLTNTTPRYYGDGVTHSNSSPRTLANGIYLLGTGGATEDQCIITFRQAVVGPMTLAFPFISNAGAVNPQLDFASVSSASSSGSSSITAAAINSYAGGSQAFLRIEAAQGGSCGNSTQINIVRDGSTLYYVSLTTVPGIGNGSATLHVFNYSTGLDITGSPQSVTGCTIYPIWSTNILGGNNPTIAGGAWFAIPGPIQFDFTGAIPLP